MKNFSINLAGITASHNPDNQYVTINITPLETDPNYQDRFAVLRGRYGYKTSIDDSNTHILLDSTDAISEISIVDDSVEPGVLYYYSIVFLMEVDGSDVWQHNPNLHLVTGFGNKYINYRNTIYSLLPIYYRDADERSNLKKYIDLLSYPLEIARTEIDIRTLNNNIFYVPEDRLPALASLIGWSVNRELDVETQRFEILESTRTYQSKGRHEAISHLIEFVTGWKVQIEEGVHRIFTLGDSLLDENDVYQLTHVNLPWIPFDETFVSTDVADQVFTLVHNSADRIVVRTGDEYWLEVDDLSIYADEYVYRVVDVGSDRTLVFGDGINGNIPTGDIHVEYVYGGDSVTYTPDPFNEWKHETGFRLLLSQQEGSVPFNDVFINKVARIVDLFKASYANYVIYILDEFGEEDLEVVSIPVDSYSDTEEPFSWFLLDSSPMDDSLERMV